MGSALSGIATIAMGQMNASAKAQAATEDAQEEQRMLAYNAQRAGERGRAEAGRIRSSGAQLVEQQKVAYAASGVALDTGTPASVMASSAGLSEKDALTAENDAAAEVWGYRMQSAQSKKNLQRAYDAANREVIGSALSGSGQIIGSGGMGGGGGG